ncbi:MAG: DUF4286 family protein [Acidobacteriota bacterium]
MNDSTSETKSSGHGPVAYTVAITFKDSAVAERFMAWLQDGHLQDVVDAGALDARAVILDGEPLRLEARYTFASRSAFEAYERDHAPRLREEGLTLFPLDLGLSYQRSVGEIFAAVIEAP